MDAAKMESAPRWNTTIKMCQKAADLKAFEIQTTVASAYQNQRAQSNSRKSRSKTISKRRLG
jgi:uncharacterized membrane protein